MLKIAVIVFIAILTFSCTSSENSYIKKIDASLLKKIDGAEKENPEQEIQFLGKCIEPISEDVRKDIETLGVSVQSVVNNIFTASAKPSAIKLLAEKKYIETLEYSSIREMKK